MSKWSIIVCLLLFFTSIQITKGQSHLKEQVAYCKHEVELLEAEVKKLKGLLQTQNKELMDLKMQIIAKGDEVDALQKQNDDLQMISVSLLNLGIKYEEEGDFRKSIEIYKLLIKNYPRSLEAAASRLKVHEIKKVNDAKK